MTSAKYKNRIKNIILSETKSYFKKLKEEEEGEEEEVSPAEPEAEPDEDAMAAQAEKETEKKAAETGEQGGEGQPAEKAGKSGSGDFMAKLLGMHVPTTGGGYYGSEEYLKKYYGSTGSGPKSADIGGSAGDTRSQGSTSGGSGGSSTGGSAGGDRSQKSTSKGKDAGDRALSDTPKTPRGAVLNQFEWVSIDKRSKRTKKDLFWNSASDVHLDDIMFVTPEERYKIFEELMGRSHPQADSEQKLNRFMTLPRLFHDAPAEVIGAVLLSFNRYGTQDVADAFRKYHTNYEPGKTDDEWKSKEMARKKVLYQKYKQMVYKRYLEIKAERDRAREDPSDPFASNPYAKEDFFIED